MARLLVVFTVLLSMVAFIPMGCDSSEVGSPELSTWPAAEITRTSARLNGRLTKLGSLTQVSVHFIWQCYEQVPEGGDPWPIHMTENQVMTDVGDFSAVISSLEPGTKYIFQAVAAADEFTGSPDWFVTAGAIETLDATGITTSSATLNGNLAILRGVSRQVCFAWGTTSGSLSQGTPWHTMTSTGTFSAEISGLSAGTTYYFLAKDDMGGRGEEKSFYVAGESGGTVETLDATFISTTFVTLKGNLVSLGGASSVEVYFKYGTESGVYPNETTHQTMTDSGEFSIQVLAVFTPDTTYYFVARVGATGQGTERSFYVY